MHKDEVLDMQTAQLDIVEHAEKCISGRDSLQEEMNSVEKRRVRDEIVIRLASSLLQDGDTTTLQAGKSGMHCMTGG